MTAPGQTIYEATIPRGKIGLSPSCGSMIALDDGRLMLAWGHGSAEPVHPVMVNYSSDGGRTWTDPVPHKLESGADLTGVIAPQFVRLPSGALAMALKSAVEKQSRYLDTFYQCSFHVSRDEGRTWSPGIPINGKNEHTRGESSNVDGVICLSSGRLVVPFSKTMGPSPAAEKLRSENLFGEPLMGGWTSSVAFSYVYYSDDEGLTWRRSHNEVHASVDGGMGGAFPMSEPQVAELDDGRLLLMALTPLGRMFRSYSTDRGESWLEAEPTDLAVRGGGSFALKNVAGTGDLLIIWCQLSRFEAMQGLYRHRLSCAVSKDGGLSWQNHRNLVSLDDVTRIEPGPIVQWLSGPVRQPLDRQRYHRAPGPLRNDHAYCTFHGGKAIVVHGQGVLGERAVIEQTYGMEWDALVESLGFEPNPRKPPSSVWGNNKVHVLPVDWLYGGADSGSSS